MRLEVPAPHETFEVALEDGARIKVRRHGRPDGVRLFMSHGNGFAIDAYLPYWQHFLAALRRHRVRLPQPRPERPGDAGEPHLCAAHPRSRAGLPGRQREARQPQVGRHLPFHVRPHRHEACPRDRLSLGCAGAVRPAQRSAARPSRLCRHGGVRGAADGVRPQPPHAIIASVEELAVEYAKSRAGQAWAPGVHDLMARAVLRKNPAGDGFVLVCDPANEAGIYAEAMTMNLWPKATDFRGAGQADRRRSRPQGRPADRPRQPGAGHRERLRLQLRPRHRAPAAGRKSRGVRAADARIPRRMRAEVTQTVGTLRRARPLVRLIVDGRARHRPFCLRPSPAR